MKQKKETGLSQESQPIVVQGKLKLVPIPKTGRRRFSTRVVVAEHFQFTADGLKSLGFEGHIFQKKGEIEIESSVEFIDTDVNILKERIINWLEKNVYHLPRGYSI